MEFSLKQLLNLIKKIYRKGIHKLHNQFLNQMRKFQRTVFYHCR